MSGTLNAALGGFASAELRAELNARGEYLTDVPSSELADALIERGDYRPDDGDCNHCPLESDAARPPIEDLELIQVELLRGRLAAGLALPENVMRGTSEQ